MQQSFRHLPQACAASDSFNRPPGGIDGYPVLPAEYPQPLDMIHMLMGDQNAVQFFSLDS